MFKLLKNNKGQGFAAQYALTFFFVLAVVVAMTVYFKRTLQGRIRDATVYMANTVHTVYSGRVPVQYEPYYAESEVNRYLDSTRESRLLPSFNSEAGIFLGAETTGVSGTSFSNPAPPRPGARY